VVHPLTNRTELHGTRGSILEDHSWELPVKIFSSHTKAEIKGEFYAPNVEHGPFPEYYKISMGKEDDYFAECIINEMEPEFTPEEARKGVAMVLLSYLSAKKGTTATMEELMDIYRKSNTKTILNNLDKVIKKNFQNISWVEN